MKDELQSILLNYRASLHNNFEGNDEALTKARDAILLLFNEHINKVKPSLLGLRDGYMVIGNTETARILDEVLSTLTEKKKE